MSTDEEKSRILKLLQDLEVPENKLPERCQSILRDLEQNNAQGDDVANDVETAVAFENPYVPDKKLLEENERKLRELLLEEKHEATTSSERHILQQNGEKRSSRSFKKNNDYNFEYRYLEKCEKGQYHYHELESSRQKRKEVEEISNNSDPKRPWRTNSSKEKLLRIDCDLKRHLGRANELIEPLTEDEMQQLVKNCREDVMKSPAVGADRMRETVDEARRTLPNFQYRKVDNTTATAILPEAHGVNRSEEPRGDGDGIQ